MKFQSAKMRAAGMLLAAIAISSCHRAPTPVASSSPSAAIALIADPWFTCVVAGATTTYVASKPSASGVFKLQELDGSKGAVVNELNLRQGAPDAGAGNLYTPFLLDGKEFGTLHSLNGGMLDPPSSQNLPVELRMGDRTMTCARPATTEESAELKLSAALLQGTWSFDRSCASGDGMSLQADGSASFGGWGVGTWSLAGSHRLELALRRVESGEAGSPKERRVRYSINVTEYAADKLVGALIAADSNEGPRPLNAKRCGP